VSFPACHPTEVTRVPTTLRFKGILLGFVSCVVACGELSTTPGDLDGGVSLRRRCDEHCGTATVCSAGECVLSCTGIGTCEFDRYCHTDATCEPNERRTCAQAPCNADQACVNEVCTTLKGTSCAASPGCHFDTDCDPDTNRCATLVPCDNDGSCHPGTRGAVCVSAADLSSFEVKRCVPGRCRTAVHCPANLGCVDIGADGSRLGVCR